MAWRPDQTSPDEKQPLGLEFFGISIITLQQKNCLPILEVFAQINSRCIAKHIFCVCACEALPDRKNQSIENRADGPLVGTR